MFATVSTRAHLKKRLSQIERSAIKINEESLSAITGMMLSDGHIALRSTTSNARFVFAQSNKPAKKEYFDLVLTIMSPFCTANYVPYIREWYDNKTLSTYSSITLTTMQLPCFNDLRALWYENGVKVIPTNISDLLSPVALAHWIMGDGSKQNEGLHLSVYAYTSLENSLLVETLTNKYSLHCTIHSTDKGDRIYIDKKSMNILVPIVLPHIVPSMRYKLSL